MMLKEDAKCLCQKIKRLVHGDITSCIMELGFIETLNVQQEMRLLVTNQ